MATHALVSPENEIVRKSSRVDESARMKPGWRWLKIERTPSPETSALQRVETTEVVDKNVVRLVHNVTTRAATKDDVNAERDRRLQTLSFNGKQFDFGAESITNINGAGTLALGAIVIGAEPGDLRWANPDQDFAWIAADNSSMTMDAQTCFDFAKAAAGWKAAHIHAARALKDMKTIPEDYTSDAYWP